MTTAAKKARAKLLRRPVGLVVVRAIVLGPDGKPETGEVVPAFVPAHPIDRRSCRERKFHVGMLLRAELKRDRNPGFWRKAHVLAGWLTENVEQFQGLGVHDALKRLQELSGVGVSAVEYDIPNVGKLTRNEAESLNFSDCDEGRFNELWSGADGEGGWIGWLRREVFGGLDEVQLEEIEEMLRKPE